MNIHNLHTQQQLKKVEFSTKNIERNVIRDHSIIPTWRENRGYILKYSHKKKSDLNKCILYVHGGGFTANQPRDDTYDTLCTILVHLTNFGRVLSRLYFSTRCCVSYTDKTSTSISRKTVKTVLQNHYWFRFCRGVYCYVFYVYYSNIIL